MFKILLLYSAKMATRLSLDRPLKSVNFWPSREKRCEDKDEEGHNIFEKVGSPRIDQDDVEAL